ncbi:uncharacterized protein LOC143033936 [Oratosquilla oratoria]|uniref:uncharacterized protein LOC143033936 n=1 Tax=Oratosquilla oratoria TaxID=337810 RepID=UPI003F76EC35
MKTQYPIKRSLTGVLPESQTRCHELSLSAMRERRAKMYDTALDVALQMITLSPPTPSISKSLSAVVESAINVVLSELQANVGFAVIQSVHQIFEDFKEKQNF